MTPLEKARLFDWVSLANRRINFGLLGGRVVLVFGGRKPANAHVVERLDAVVDEAEGVTDDGRTLNIGALGIASIAEYLNTIPTYRRSPKQLCERLSMLFSGSSFYPEMIRATVRAALGHPGVGGDTGYYIDHAKRQFEPWTAGSVSVRVIGSEHVG